MRGIYENVLCLTYSSEEAVNASLRKINENCGFPNYAAKQWDVALQAANNPNLWFFRKPPAKGFNGFTQEFMLRGVNIEGEEEFKSEWINEIA